MGSNYREQFQEMIDEAERLGAAARIEHRGKHLSCVVTLEGRSRFVVFGASSSDWRAGRKRIQDVRRVVRELREGKDRRCST